MNRSLRLLQLLLPDGPSGSFWEDKVIKGTDLYNYLLGFSKQYELDSLLIKKMREALSPFKTTFIKEWNQEFKNINADLTTEEERGRLLGRWELLFNNQLRFKLMTDILSQSGFDDILIRTLGSLGVAESPFDYFTDSGFAYWGSEQAIWGDEEFIYGNTEVVGDAFLLTNGGSTRYVENGPDAIVQIPQEADYWGDYFIVESTSNDPLEIEQRQYENFFDLLYLIKPASMHGIIRVNIV